MNSVHDSAKEWRVHPSQPLSQPEGGLQSNEQAHYSPVDQQQFAHPYQQQPSMSLQHPPPPSPHATSYHGKPDDEKAQGMAGSSQPSTPRPNPAADGSQQPTSSPTRGAESAAAAAAAAAAASYSGFHGNDYMMARKRGRSDSLFPPETGPFFSSTKSADNLYAMDRSTLLDVAIHAKMDRGFFLADNDWTCYRRNYFQVSACFSIQSVSHYFSDHELQTLVRGEDGALFPVRRFLIGISARVSNSEKRIELVQHTPKRDKGPQMVPQPKPIIPGGNLNLSTVSTNQSIATFERIQFKTATANNGKRRAAQQYYVCLVELYAETDHGQIKVAACQSAPLVVRGRSPGHYADHQERMGQMVTTSAPSQHSQHLSTPPQPPQPLSLPPPPPPSSHDDRFHSAFPRPPYTPPAIMPSEYGAAASYPPYYSPYTHFGGHPMHAPPMPHTMMMNNAPPTPTHHTPSTSTPGQAASPYPHAAAAPSHHHQHPYVISSMPPPDPNSPSSPTPHIYGSAAAAEYPNQQHHQQQHEDTKLALPPPPPHSSASPNGMSVPPPVPMESTVGGDWNGAGNRSRTNTAGGSPHYFAPHQGTPTLSSAASQTSAFSPTTPTTPYVGARKFNTVNNICNQQQAS